MRKSTTARGGNNFRTSLWDVGLVLADIECCCENMPGQILQSIFWRNLVEGAELTEFFLKQSLRSIRNHKSRLGYFVGRSLFKVACWMLMFQSSLNLDEETNGPSRSRPTWKCLCHNQVRSFVSRCFNDRTGRLHGSSNDRKAIADCIVEQQLLIDPN